MKFLDKLNKLAEKLVTSVEETASDVSKTYKDKGINGFVEKASDNFDSLSAKTKDYYSTIAQTNKEILKSNTSKSLEDKIVTVAAVVVNTAQTIVQDAVKTVAKTEEKVAEQTQETVAPASTKADTVVTKTKKQITPLSEQLNDGEIASLNFTPLEIVLENIGATSTEKRPDRWTTTDKSTIIVVQDKWHCFTNGATGHGAVSLVKFALNNEQKSSLTDPHEDKILTNEALRTLQSYHNESNYQSRVSDWIKKEHEFAQKKIGLITAKDLTEMAQSVEEQPVKKVAKPRVRKPKLTTVENTPVEDVTPEVTATDEKPKRKRKMN